MKNDFKIINKWFLNDQQLYKRMFNFIKNLRSQNYKYEIPFFTCQTGKKILTNI